jgi:eukaryotic-like serine/threonine-protein kinase
LPNGLSRRPRNRFPIDSYRIEAPVARSGMATIYRAIDLRDNRVVALKIPHPDLESDPILFDRFQREAGIGERLNHPKVMRVLAAKIAPAFTW